MEIKIISGRFLSDRKVDNCGEVDVYDQPTDAIRKESRTRVVPNNSLNAVCGKDAVLVFRKIRSSSDSPSMRKQAGQRVFPLDGLQTGCQHILLRIKAEFLLSLPCQSHHASPVYCRLTIHATPPGYAADGILGISFLRHFATVFDVDHEQVGFAKLSI
ncbi:phospholipase C beta [Clonorchis sinensis]|uniref:Phospholipase C beta n=1 Tax=Clonorchis sinensis TaxID=79923 RepID=G7YLF6_CLOSI|nr:phospholipase C beta [Clonorchis sinensis]